MPNRTVCFYKHHFKEFFAAQTPQVKKKIAFQKKTQRTPRKEIEKAEKLMNEYFNEKDNENE